MKVVILTDQFRQL